MGAGPGRWGRGGSGKRGAGPPRSCGSGAPAACLPRAACRSGELPRPCWGRRGPGLALLDPSAGRGSRSRGGFPAPGARLPKAPQGSPFHLPAPSLGALVPSSSFALGVSQVVSLEAPAALILQLAHSPPSRSTAPQSSTWPGPALVTLGSPPTVNRTIPTSGESQRRRGQQVTEGTVQPLGISFYQPLGEDGEALGLASSRPCLRPQ